MAEEKKLSGPDFAAGVSISEFADGGIVQGHTDGEAIHGESCPGWLGLTTD